MPEEANTVPDPDAGAVAAEATGGLVGLRPGYDTVSSVGS